MKKSIQRAWEQLSIYLPVLLMALLALATWWLVRNAPQPLSSQTDQTVSADPDYVMQDFSVLQFDAAGRMQSEIRGKVARHYPKTDILEIDEVQTRSIDATGVVTTSSAQRGISNSDATEVQLWGQAKVQRASTQGGTDLIKVESDFLHAWTQEERVRSNRPVILTRSRSRFTADSMDYDNINQVIELKGRVRGFIASGK